MYETISAQYHHLHGKSGYEQSYAGTKSSEDAKKSGQGPMIPDYVTVLSADKSDVDKVKQSNPPFSVVKALTLVIKKFNRDAEQAEAKDDSSGEQNNSESIKNVLDLVRGGFLKSPDSALSSQSHINAEDVLALTSQETTGDH